MTHRTQKHYTYDYSFMIKVTNQDQPNEETHRLRSWRITDNFCVLGICYVSSIPMCLIIQEAYLSYRCPEFLLGFCYIGMIDWIIGHKVELSLVLLLSLEFGLISCGSKPQPFNCMLVFLVWPAPILSPLISMNNQSSHE